MTLDAILERLEEYGEVRPAGNGYVACCPAHEDSEPSLGVTEADGKLLLSCHAGCATQDILDVLELSWSDLFVHARNYAEPDEVYSYVDEAGKELFQALRFNKPGGGKDFRQRHRDEEGQWVYNLDGVRRVLFNLPRVIEAVKNGETIYVTEGEKDARRLEQEGKVATCNPMGAGKWREEYAVFLEGAAQVIVVVDRDEPGRKHAEDIRASLTGRVGALHFVRAKTGKDAYDHLEAGHAVEEFVIEKDRVRRGIITASEMADQALEDLTMNESDLPGYVLTPSVPLVFRQGRMYAIGAYTGDGKTCFALQGLRTLAEAGKRVGYFSLEMPERDLRNRLACHHGIPLSLLEEPWKLRQDAGAMAKYEHVIEGMRHWNADIVFESGMTAKRVTDITRDREYEAVFIDHMHRFAWGKDRRDFEDQLQGLTNLALEQNIMLVVLCQLRRFQRGKDMAVYPKPTLQDFRESEVIGQDAAMALSIWRQREADGVKYTGYTEVTVLKNRHTTGPVDRAGRGFIPIFDQTRQMFLPQQEVSLATQAA